MKKENILFGLNGFKSLINSKDYKVKKVLIETNSKASKYLQSIRLDKEITKKLIFLNRKEFSNFSKNNRTQGLIAHFEGKLTKILPSFKNINTNVGLLVLDQIEDPQNLGQIIRTAECAGIDGIIISKNNGCGISNAVIQVSQGAFFNIPVYEVSNIDQCLRVLKKEDFWVVALENDAGNKNWYEIDYRKKIIIMLGSEGNGIKKINLKNSDFIASIPMQGHINSLNVSAATSVVLFERLRQLKSDTNSY